MGNEFKASFEGGEKLKDDEFMFFWADFLVLQVQYGSRTEVCNNLKNKTVDQQFDYLFELALKVS